MDACDGVVRASAEQTLEQWNEDQTDRCNAAARHELFHTLAFCTRIIIAVAFQKIDDTPNAKTAAQRRNERLKDIDCGIEKLHI